MANSPQPAAPIGQVPHSAFGRAFWMLNSIEAFERLAYFGIRAVVPIYIMQATEPGGLHLSATHKGIIYAWWGAVQSFLPLFTGGIADRYGYKRVLCCAISTNVIGYLMMAYLHSYAGFFAGVLILALGTAFFKPSLQGSIAQNLTKENSSLGWGIFYWIVNIGGFAAPFFSTIVLGKPHSASGWQNLFLISAGFTAANLLLLFTFRDVPSGADKTQSLARVFWITIENIWPYWFRGGRLHGTRTGLGAALAAAGIVVMAWGRVPLPDVLRWLIGLGLLAAGVVLILWLVDGRFTWQLRLPVFLLIMSAFWLMMYQVWDLHPNFIEDWVDSSMVARQLPFDLTQEFGDRGLLRVPQQILLSTNAGLIILLVLPVSWLVRRMRTLSAMLIGMTTCTVGTLVAGLTGNGWIFLLGIVFFSLGEMLTGPKKNQYLGLIAPPGKKGLYLGYVNIPVGIGLFVGSAVAGYVYDHYGEKASLALKYMADRPALMARAARATEWGDSLEFLPDLLQVDRATAFDHVCEQEKQPPDAVANRLRAVFRYDARQINNFALQYLALHSDCRGETFRNVASTIEKAKNVSAADRADAEKLRRDADLKDGSDPVGIARFVHLLPKASGVDRTDALVLAREELERSRPSAGTLDDAAVEERLWARFGDDPATLNNLALQYLAQGTPALEAPVAKLLADAQTLPIDARVELIEKRLGIGRTKSFAALTRACGADDARIETVLATQNVPDAMPNAALYVYLMEKRHYQFMVSATTDWHRNIRLLRELIEPDPQAVAAVQQAFADEGWLTRTSDAFVGFFRSTVPEDGSASGIPFVRLAGKPEIIRAAFANKDWSRSPEQAARLLRLNPFEARARAAAEINDAANTTTGLLWTTYDPQYKVWIPFAAIGVVAMIALAIFGQMAKRWADMNA
ncbi:MAG: MFS transporter [Phycisphaerae bacterium]|nr:MFS transporter [Phycisphaerae bacterium]